MKKILSIIVIVIQVLIILLFFFDNVITYREETYKKVYSTETEAKQSNRTWDDFFSDATINKNGDKMSIFEAGNDYGVEDDKEGYKKIALEIEMWSYLVCALLSIVICVLHMWDIKLPKRIEEKRKKLFSIIVVMTNIEGIILLIRMCNVSLSGYHAYPGGANAWDYVYGNQIDWYGIYNTLHLSGSFIVYLECFLMISMIILALILLWDRNIEKRISIWNKKMGNI